MALNKAEMRQLATWQSQEEIENQARAGNNNSARHGIFVSKLLDDDERDFFDDYVASLVTSLRLTAKPDIAQAQLVGIYLVQIQRAIRANESDAQDRLDRMMNRNLKALRATRETRTEEQVQGQSVCEVVSEFLAAHRNKNKGTNHEQKSL